jgi:hypothetical protein
MTSGKMDDPVEASFEAWQPASPNLGERHHGRERLRHRRTCGNKSKLPKLWNSTELAEAETAVPKFDEGWGSTESPAPGK